MPSSSSSSPPRLDKIAEGQFRLSGRLNYRTVPAVWRVGLDTFRSSPSIDIDLQGVLRSDSAGLALLIDWMRVAREANKPVTYRNMPSQMMAIATASNLEKILPLATE